MKSGRLVAQVGTFNSDL